MASSISIFDPDWYLHHNKDVADAVQAGHFTAEEHYELFGKAEGRNPGPLFNVEDYLSANSDVKKAVEEGHTTAYDHFLAFGAEEGRAPLALFDAAFYLQQNEDVATVVQNSDMTAVQHFLTFGQYEPRPFSPSIDLGKYMAANQDVATAVESGVISAFEHLMIFGAAEGRDLGNGIDLAIFQDDAKFKDALEAGNVDAALARVDAVAPFLPSFDAPEGWTPASNTPIPTDFVPPEGVKLVIPEGVEVPEDELPDTFEPPVTPFTVSFTDLPTIATTEAGFLFAGKTNPSNGFVVANNEEAGIQLGLDMRYSGDATNIAPTTSPNVFTVDPAQVGALRFAYSVTSLDGKGETVAIDLDKYDFKLSIDTDPGEGTNFVTFSLAEQDTADEPNDAGNPSPYEWVENVSGDAVARVITDDGGNAHTTQNIQAIDWYLEDGKTLQEGEAYTVQLDAFVKGTDKVMASSDIIIAVGTPDVAPPADLPA